METRTNFLIWLAIVLIISCIVVFAATARDLGQWEWMDPEIRAWYSQLKQPDNKNISCCGEADAYWCDRITVENEQTYCTITDTRDDSELRRPHVDVGTKIAIPSHKFGPGQWGNPTGHAIVFLSYNRNVYCFVQQGGV